MDRDIDEINVIPLVDVMLVLLTIVLTTATFIAQGEIPVDLAVSTQAQQANMEAPLLLSLKADGSLYLGKTPIAMENLPDALGGYSRTKLVVLSADRAIMLEKFVMIVDEIKRNGFPNVSLVVERANTGA
jgi:biopolymer transport protein ExbD